MLEVKELSVSYGKHRALGNVGLRVNAGELVVILGTNGAGKSSLLRAIGGMQRCHPGASAKLDGQDLLLDEPSIGLAPLMCAEVFRVIERIRGMGVGILMVEQNVALSLRIANRGYLMRNGRVIGEGTARALSPGRTNGSPL